MSAEAEGRSEKPTQKQKDKFRKEGSVAKSVEVNTFAQYLTGLLVISFAGIFIFRALADITVHALEQVPHAPRGDTTFVMLNEYALHLAVPLIPILAIIWLGIFAVNVAQFGFKISWKAIEPKWQKLNVFKNFKNIMISSRAIMELAKSVVKIIVLGTITWHVMQPIFEEFTQLYQLSPVQIGGVMWEYARTLWIQFILFVLVLAAIDASWQRYSLNQKMKMTKSQVKDEMKQAEGDPMVKGKQRSRNLQFMKSLMLQNVKDADVVITNPTHFAVALGYKHGQMDAPKVLAKGVDYLALSIRKQARKHAIPIVENKPLARALYYAGDIGAEIPERLFRPVAEILAWIFRLNKERNVV